MLCFLSNALLCGLTGSPLEENELPASSNALCHIRCGTPRQLLPSWITGCVASDPLPKFPGLPLRSEMSLVLLGGNCPGLDLGEAAKSSPTDFVSALPFLCLIVFPCFQWSVVRGVVREENHESLYCESE